MLSKLMMLVMVVMLSSCTMFAKPNPMFDYDLVDDCPDVDCVIDTMDEHRYATHNPDRRIGAMEGMPPLSLREYMDYDRLKIKRANDLVLAAMWMSGSPLFGYATFSTGLYGGMYQCTATYSGVDSWDILVHELQHCMGYKEGAFTGYPNFILPGLTEEQKDIMKAEGVDKWTDTDFFKYTIPIAYEYTDEQLEWHRATWLSQ